MSQTPRRRPAAEAQGIEVDASRVARYLRLSGARDHTSPSPLVPPLYSSFWETALALELFTSDELPFPRRGVLHVESEVVSLRPIRLSDHVRCRVELDRAEPQPRGLRLTLKARHWNSSGQLCQENVLTLLVPHSSAVGGPAGSSSEEEDAAEWLTIDEWHLPGNLGRRYARLSGDLNPIHLWRLTARLLGYERPVLHGFCTAGMVASALSRRYWEGDQNALRRLRIRFRAPLFLPVKVRLVACSDTGGSAGRFRVIDAGGLQEKRPYAEGEFVGG